MHQIIDIAGNIANLVAAILSIPNAVALLRHRTSGPQHPASDPSTGEDSRPANDDPRQTS